MEKLGRFKTQDLSDKMKLLYIDYCNDVAALGRENRYLSSRLMSVRRENRIFERLLIVSMAANGLLLGILI